MHLEPYVRVDRTPFSATTDQVRETWGPPSRTGRNAVALNELDYGHVVFRFQDNGRLEEITAWSPVVHLGRVAVPFAALQAFIGQHDHAAFERAGFTVSPGYGLAFDPTGSPWVTALARHSIAQWKAIPAGPAPPP